jgi:zinc and cadmium transporter
VVEVLLPILLAVILVSLISLVGVIFFFLRTKTIEKAIFPLVAFASGSLLGAAFLNLLPETLDQVASTTVFPIVLFGIVIFFVLERVLYWHHCHDGICEVHPFTYLNLIGDGTHNFVDGMIIAASFLLSVPLGVVTTVAVILHEVPQELGDFGILMHGGFSRRRALSFNFLSAMAAVGGALITYFYLDVLNLSPLLIAFAAGGFIYLACVDLLPRLHGEVNRRKSIFQLLLFLAGIAVIQISHIFVG